MPIFNQRRSLLTGTAALAASALLPGAVAATLAPAASPAPVCLMPNARLPTIRPPRLKPGDTVALFNASGAIFERLPYVLATESLQALGFKVREAPNLRARYGHFAGTAQQRADDINALFADDSVQGLMAIIGGSGANRVLPLLDYGLMRSHPKVLAGFSDVTALLNAVNARTGLVTFHAPVGTSDWNAFSTAQFRAVVMAESIDGKPPALRNSTDRGNSLVQRENRIQTLRPGIARGPLVGGNLSVLASLAGSHYLPSFDGACLFIEDINEYIYRVDRMLSTLKLMGALDRLAGVVLGHFTNCNPGDGYGTLTLDEVFDDYFLPLGVPVFRGAMIGHIPQKFTVPVGLDAEIDATAGTISLLTQAVV